MPHVKQEEIQPLMTVRQVAERLAVKTATVRSFIQSGMLRASDVASPGCTHPRWRIHETDLMVFLNARSAQQPTKPKRRRRQTPEVIEYY